MGGRLSVPDNIALSARLTMLTISVPAGVTRSAPAGVTRSVPAGVTRSVPAGVTRSVLAGVTRSVPAGVTRSVPAESLDRFLLESLDCHYASLPAAANAINSYSIVEPVMHVCLLEAYEMTPPPSRYTHPLVDDESLT
nr:hypothetical protein GLYMA_17G188000 [Tanacetum cinerariifolium]